MNLAVNARDAMPSSGHLVIETAHLDLDENSVKEHPEVEPGPYVQLTISDPVSAWMKPPNPISSSRSSPPRRADSRRGWVGRSTLRDLSGSSGTCEPESTVTNFKVGECRENSGEAHRDTWRVHANLQSAPLYSLWPFCSSRRCELLTRSARQREVVFIWLRKHAEFESALQRVLSGPIKRRRPANSAAR